MKIGEIVLNLVELSQNTISHLKFLKLNHQCFHVLFHQYCAVRDNCEVKIALVYLTILSSFSIFSFILTMSLFIVYIISSFSCHSRSYSSSLLVIKSIASFKEINWFLPIISLSFVFFTYLENFFHLYFQLFHATTKNCYTVIGLQKFSKNLCICGICNRIVQAGLSKSL